MQLREGEQHIVDNGYLVAWNCDYRVEFAGNSKWNSLKSKEGLVCRFYGPGTIYLQTRNMEHFAEWVKEQIHHENGREKLVEWLLAP
jgi:uncharacterized protein (AIM24 family)